MAAALFGRPGHAGGVLVRLDADRVIDGDVFVDLQPAEGDSERVQLQDDGQQPDVTAGDGRWAGAVYLPQTQVKVSLVLDGARIDGGDASWSAPDIPRDLDLSLRGEELKVTAREANPHGGGNEAGPGAGGGTGGAVAAAAQAESDEGMALILGGLGLFLVMAMAGLVFRRRERIRRGPVSGVTIQPPGGFAGPGSPSLHDGLVHWSVADADAELALRALVESLARHHGVLVVGASLPEGLGGAGRRIFTDADASPRRVGDVLEAIHENPRESGVVVFFGVDGTVDDWADRDDELPLGSGGIVLHQRAAPELSPSFRVGATAPGVCTVTRLADGASFYIGDRGRWPAAKPSAVVNQ